MTQAANDVSDSTLRLLLADGIGPATLRKLRTHFGDDPGVIGAPSAALDEVAGIGRDKAEALRRAIGQADVETERRAMTERSVRLMLQDDPGYPPLLRTIADPPPGLWVRGSFLETDRLAVAVVGSRKCTAYGREQASRFASLLAQAGLTIVSGGALGIDGEAHRGALRAAGRTIVVMGCGLGVTYPPEHEELFNKIVSENAGALVSEFPMRTPPIAGNFPRRNRVISGLCLGVLVIEAARRSGALITARIAAEDQHREVMALPGRVDSPASAGCLKMLREGWAALVTSHADVLEQLDSSGQLVRGALEAAGHEGAATAATLFDGGLSDGQRAIVKSLEDEGAADGLLAEQLAGITGLPLGQIIADITLLQIRGRVAKDWSGAVRLKR